MINKNIKLVSHKQAETDFVEQDLIEAPDSFFLEINVVDVLETSATNDILEVICSKIRKGGKVILSGVDGLNMCRQVFFGLVSLQDASTSFFRHVNNINSIGKLKEFFLNNKWHIDFIGLDNDRYLIEATKP